MQKYTIDYQTIQFINRARIYGMYAEMSENSDKYDLKLADKLEKTFEHLYREYKGLDGLGNFSKIPCVKKLSKSLGMILPAVSIVFKVIGGKWSCNFHKAFQEVVKELDDLHMTEEQVKMIVDWNRDVGKWGYDQYGEDWWELYKSEELYKPVVSDIIMINNYLRTR